jgi:hypothetical protein
MRILLVPCTVTVSVNPETTDHAAPAEAALVEVILVRRFAVAITDCISSE